MKKALMTALTLGMVFSGSAFAAPALDDNQVAQVVLTIDKGEIKAAKLAEKKASSEDVKDFARRMMSAHNKNMRSVKSLLKTTKMGTKDSTLSKDLKTQAMIKNKELRKTDKDSFDRDYMEAQVDMHQKALSTINDTLLPNAKNAALKDLLEKTRTTVSSHLARAKEIQAKLQ